MDTTKITRGMKQQLEMVKEIKELIKESGAENTDDLKFLNNYLNQLKKVCTYVNTLIKQVEAEKANKNFFE